MIEPAEINWGPTDCLFDAPRTLKVTNDGLIPAPFKTFIKNALKYRVDIREGVLMPPETVDLCMRRTSTTRSCTATSCT